MSSVAISPVYPAAAANRLDPSPVAPARVSRLACLFAAYLAVPVLEVPFFGLSLSAPLFCFLAFDCLSRPIDWRPHQKWIVLAAVFWTANLLSLTANVFRGNLVAVTSAQGRLLTRFAFWLLVFVVTTLLVYRFGLGRRLSTTLAVGVVVLGALRLAEAALFGHWGGGNPRFLSQNDYGFGFSAFAPFAVWFALETRGPKRIPAAVGVLIVLSAVIGNGSRSSWITVALGLLLILLLWGRARARNLLGGLSRWLGLSLLAVIPVALLMFGPASIKRPVIERATTLERLDRDKPFLARQLLVEKGLTLFRENPVFGVGVGGFTQTIVPLEVPRELSYGSVEEFNRKTPHNSYIKVLAETGVLGAACLFCLLALLAWRGLPAAVVLARRGERWAVPVFIGFVTMSIHLWTLSGLTGTAPWFVYGMVAGVVESARWRGSIHTSRLVRR